MGVGVQITPFLDGYFCLWVRRFKGKYQWNWYSRLGKLLFLITLVISSGHFIKDHVLQTSWEVGDSFSHKMWEKKMP